MFWSKSIRWFRWPLRLVVMSLAILVLVPTFFLILRAVQTREAFGSTLFSAGTSSALWASLRLSIGVGVCAVGLSLPLAWLTHASDLPFRRFFRVVLNLPLAVPSYVSGFVVLVALGPSGWLRDLCLWLGIAYEFEVYGGLGAGLALMFSYPFALLVIQGALQRIDPAQWQAARSLGHAPLWAFSKVVLPQLRPAMLTGGMLVGLYVLGDFGAVSLLRYESLSYVIYLRYKSLFGREEAVFLALLLVVVALVMVAILQLSSRRRTQATESGTWRWPVVSLGRWRWPAFLFCSIVATAGVAVPVGVLIFWLVRGLRLGHEIAWPWREGLNALWLGGMAAAIMLLLALVPTLLARLRSGDKSRGLRWVAASGYALPGIVIGLSLVYLSIHHVRPLYQTVYLLLMAYLIRFLPLTVGAVDDAISRQNPHLFESARSLGCGPVTAWRRAVLPAARSALLTGLLASFVAVVKELPATLMLRPVDFRTLATSIWSLTEEGYYSAAAPASLLMISLAAVALIVGYRERRSTVS